jgi:hypothetical protein
MFSGFASSDIGERYYFDPKDTEEVKRATGYFSSTTITLLISNLLIVTTTARARNA